MCLRLVRKEPGAGPRPLVVAARVSPYNKGDL